ncbi:MAG: hypothetical protein OMM_07303 [Candidatus Magnetoglobus multicellularis str. Araruama]|uniref:Leucine-binding protein domain-containing protein n=1 Tax=Candidatus Magnetoglobus multicellularis str. Araruama TaxID=890399 RepID=A0A1V1PD86_9BACT|nr:MAG: hypothetical protein OMM_07303 [Candidatus Magnetoglobus multicellularis str. Araruama]
MCNLFEKLCRILVYICLSLFITQNMPSYAASKFSDVQITVGVQNVSAIGKPAIEHAKTWEKQTGGKVKILQHPFKDLFKSFYQSLTQKQPVYDVILFAPGWAGDFFSLSG